MGQRNRPQSQQKYLRSRRLYSELFEPVNENDGGEIDPSWTVSGTFSSSNHSEYGNLYNSSQTSILPDTPVHQDELSPPPPPGQEQQEYDNMFTTTLLPLLAFFILVCCCSCSGGGAPGPEFHRGHLIRENAQRIWAMQRRKEKRREATPEERAAKIRSGVCTMKVLRKDPNTGRCHLGEVTAEEEEKASMLNTTIESKESTDTADTLPLEFDDDSGALESSSYSSSILGEGEEDDDVCPICLDGFEVGDTVMFARNLSCTHVFHEECLMQWLLERRENECPSCRAMLVEEEPDDEDDDENKNENEFNSDTDDTDTDCCNCHLENDEDETTENNSLDLESGGKSEDNTTYFIVKGRIVTGTKHSIDQKAIESECRNDPICFQGREKECDDANSFSCKRQLQRPRALSMASMDKAPLIGQNALRFPLPLRRVSQSLPIESSSSRNRKDQPCNCCRTSQDSKSILSPATAPEQQSPRENFWLDHRNRFPDLHARFYDSSSSEESSDEDDLFRRMDATRATASPRNASSIFSNSLR